jgi:hypothetical protein
VGVEKNTAHVKTNEEEEDNYDEFAFGKRNLSTVVLTQNAR